MLVHPKFLIRFALLLLLSACAPGVGERPLGDPPVAASSPQSFVYFARDRERIAEVGFLRTERLVGAQLLYAWKELETGEDEYDFSEIRKDLDFLKSNGKQLFVQIQETTFSPDRIAAPKYLQRDPKYAGGVVPQYDEEGRPAGWVLMRWNPRVRERFHRLLMELGKEFDGKIAGVGLQETAIDVVFEGKPLPPGFSYENYRAAILSNMSAAKQAFRKSVVLQYANFMPGEWLPDDDRSYLSSIYRHAEAIGVGVGAPDVMPDKKSYQDHAYHFIRTLKASIPVGVAVQDGNYIGRTNDESVPAEPWPNLVPKLFQFASGDLKSTFIFWGAQEPYFTKNVIPFFSGSP